MTSNDFKRPQKTAFFKTELIKTISNQDPTLTRTTSKKSKLKGGSVQEINDDYLAKTLQSRNKL